MIDLDLPILIIAWALLQLKAIFFWVYLWQLKDYHIGRFLAHFETDKGKRIFLNKIFLLKFLFLVLSLIADFGYGRFFPILVVLSFYALLGSKAGYDFARRRAKLPVFNFKTTVLSLASGVSLLFLLFGLPILGKLPGDLFLSFFIAIDFFNFAIITAIVLLMQPITVIWRNREIAKAKAKRAFRKELLVIGITGSYGKSSTKEFLARILSRKFKVLKTSKNQNSEIGIANCLNRELAPDHQIFICEMGAYNKGGIKFLCDITQPAVGILTGINQQHLSTFGSQKNIIDAKFELIQALPATGLAIVNSRNNFIRQKMGDISFHPAVKTIKITDPFVPGPLWLENVEIDKSKIYFTARTKGKERTDFEIDALGGEGLIEDIFMALLCARELGVGLPEMALALKNWKIGEHSTRLVKGTHGLDVIDATYSANPSGVMEDLEHLKLWSGKKKVLVMPCLIELGKEAARVHQDIGQYISDICDLAIITSKDYFEDIRIGAARNKSGKAKIIQTDKTSEIMREIRKGCMLGDVVLLESRVPQELIDILESPNFQN